MTIQITIEDLIILMMESAAIGLNHQRAGYQPLTRKELQDFPLGVQISKDVLNLFLSHAQYPN